MSRKFLEAIYGDQKGFIDLMTKDPETGLLTSDRWFEYPTWLDKMGTYCDMRSDEDVYCTVSVFTEKSRASHSPNPTAQVVWADADTCDPSNFRLEPSIIVSTSPGHWHVWWVLDEPVPAREASLVAQKISYAHRDQGCDNGWTHTKILRVPGTSNLKRGKASPVTETYTGLVYSLDEMEKAYNDVEVVTAEYDGPLELPKPLSLTQKADLEDKYIRGTAWENLYTDDPPEGASWWKRLFKLQHELYRAGLQPHEVYALCKSSKCDKFARDNRPEIELWKTVIKAHQEYQETVVEPEVSKGVLVDRNEPIPQFLTDEEKKSLPRSFVDDYVEYVATRTDSEERFQRSLAYLLLSAAFSDRGYLPKRYSKGHVMWLNLWMLIVAPTTTRKTTAKEIALEILHGYERNALDGQKIDIGSNATKEGLSKELAERDGLVSMIQTDEVAIMFREAFTKNHMEGLIGFYTELYDGQVPVALRASKDAGQPNRTNTKFLFLGTGIDSGNKGVDSILTKADFESGFLPRMLWATAPERVRKEGGYDPGYFTGDDGRNHDRKTQTISMITNLTQRARKFNPDNPSAIRMDEPAIKRFSTWHDQVLAHAETYRDPSVLACTQRLIISTEKAVALLAMYKGNVTATTEDVLVGLNQAQAWYEDFLTMYHKVSSSGFEKQLDDVEKYIAVGTGGERPEAEVKRKFPLRPQEIGDILATLVSQGRIRKMGQKLQVLAG